MGDNVKVMDVVVGLAAGAIGAIAVPILINKYAPPSISGPLSKFGTLVGGLSVGAALFYAQKGSSQATGHAVGAAAAGAALALTAYAQGPITSALGGWGYGSPPVSMNLSNYQGLLVDNNAQRGMGGLIVDNNASLGALGALSMGGDDEVGYADLVALRS